MTSKALTAYLALRYENACRYVPPSGNGFKSYASFVLTSRTNYPNGLLIELWLLRISTLNNPFAL